MRTQGALAALLLLLAACQPSPSPSPSSAQPASAPPSVTPSTVPSGAAACVPPAICRGPLPPGEYLSEGTGARIAFTLDGGGWTGLPDTPGVGFGLHLAQFPAVAISALAFTGAYFTDACDPAAGRSSMGTTPAEFLAMLTERPGITADPTVEVEVGGRPGLQVDLTTVIEGPCGPAAEAEIAVWPLPLGGPFDLYDQERARIIAVDAGSATVILIAEAQMADVATIGTGEDEYAAFLGVFAELLETMTITPL